MGIVEFLSANSPYFRYGRRHCRRLDALLVIVCCLSGTGAIAKAGRDWNQFPAIAELPTPADLYAVGDAHGDYERLAQLLAEAHLIEPNPAKPEAVQWHGGRAVLVCTGDMIDKYDHAMEVIALLRILQAQAIRAGGRVVITLGNHEAEFLAEGGTGKKSAEFETELESAGIAPTQVAAGTDAAGIGQWLRDLPAAAKVGDWFFCHAGNTGGLTLAQLREQIQTQVDERGFAVPILIGDDSLLEARMHPRPWWDWDGQAPALKDANDEKESSHADKKSGIEPGESRLRAGIEALGARHLVFGHQPSKIKFADGTERAAGDMYEKFDGLVFMIDTGMSRGVQSGRGALLHITDGSVHGVTAVYADGTATQLVK